MNRTKAGGPLARLMKKRRKDARRQKYRMKKVRWRSSIQSTKTRPGADCGSDHELPIAKFRLKLKEAGKTTRPSRFDLNQILYIVEVTIDPRDYI